MKKNNWEKKASKFYAWAIKVGIDLGDDDAVMRAFEKFN